MELEVIRGIGEDPNRPPGWIPPNPVLPPPAVLPPQIPIPARANVTEGLEIVTQGWDPETFGAYIAMAGKVQDQLGDILPAAKGIDVKGIGSSLLAGAAIGAPIVPPFGSIVGAVVGALVFLWQSGLFNKPPSAFANHGVNNWAASYAPTRFIEWVKEQHDGKVPFDRWEDLSGALIQWFLYEYGVVFVSGTGNKFYSGILDEFYIQAYGGYTDPDAAMVKLYAPLGVDYEATRRVRIETGNYSTSLIVMYKVNVDVPGAAADPVTINNNPPNMPYAEPEGEVTSGALVAGAAAIAVAVAMSR